MRIITTINEVTTRNWKVNSGEYKAKKCTVETPQEFAECDAIMVSFNSKENGKFVSWVKNGKCDIPCFVNPGNVTVGVFAYIETEGKLELRYSPTPVVMPINMGSYIEGEKPPTPTPGTYAELLKQIADLENETIKHLVKPNIWELPLGVYWVSGLVFYGTPKGSFSPNNIEVNGGGLLIVTSNFAPHEVNAFDTVYYTLIANGRVYQGTSYKMIVLDVEGTEAGEEQYEGVGTVSSFVGVSGITRNIDENSTDEQIATAKSVYDIVETFKTEIQGNLDTVSALVGGAE